MVSCISTVSEASDESDSSMKYQQSYQSLIDHRDRPDGPQEEPINFDQGNDILPQKHETGFRSTPRRSKSLDLRLNGSNHLDIKLQDVDLEQIQRYRSKRLQVNDHFS
jgi:hypothetical protein